ncbi:hypothetical protein L1987_57621 [Smallanthus sonchifolius]|uniref:Uncharacterized protein n=1 Tax=Smallanthus sonchifolius TaxID=185202 RepID=A0ACB9DDJ5_9ASTR|nr:hypothetical protein L1987_57621 [Smallanthus sonchifolius]
MAPSFYKVLLDPTAPHLPLPPDFVNMHLENKIPTDPVTISANGGYSWSLKLEKVGDGYCFTNGWNKVVEDIPLDLGDFLCFRLVDQSTFRMSIYGLDGCEMTLPPKTEHDEDLVLEDDDDDDDDDEEDDPIFTSVITETHKKMLIVTMKNLDGKEWDMGLRLDISFKPKRNYLSKGWPDKPKRPKSSISQLNLFPDASVIESSVLIIAIIDL